MKNFCHKKFYCYALENISIKVPYLKYLDANFHLMRNLGLIKRLENCSEFYGQLSEAEISEYITMYNLDKTEVLNAVKQNELKQQFASE